MSAETQHSYRLRKADGTVDVEVITFGSTVEIGNSLVGLTLLGSTLAMTNPSIDGAALPAADDGDDLGSAALRWQQAYISDRLNVGVSTGSEGAIWVGLAAEGIVKTASLSGAKFQEVVVTETLSAMSGATVVTTDLVPAGAMDVEVVGIVETLIEGATSFNAGDGVDADLFGAALTLTAGTTFDPTDYTAVIAKYDYTAAGLDVTLTAVGSNFTAGAVKIVAKYRIATIS